MRIYVIGSLRNPAVPQVAKRLREAGFLVFDDWYAAGPEADDKWQAYEQARGRTFAQALEGEAARHVFNFDRQHLDLADAVVLVLPAGKSGHLELGWALGRGKRGYVLLDGEPERFDVMYQFADGVVTSVEELVQKLAPRKPCDPRHLVRLWNGSIVYTAIPGLPPPNAQCIQWVRDNPDVSF